jgi:REP element-mobilizing transposase RayT
LTALLGEGVKWVNQIRFGVEEKRGRDMWAIRETGRRYNSPAASEFWHHRRSIRLRDYVLGDDSINDDRRGEAFLKAPNASPLHQHFKSVSTGKINQTRDTSGLPVWQRNHYEHIVRDERELEDIREYIVSNPTRWETDVENPAVQDAVK